MKKIFFLLLNILASTAIFAQQGKDGVGSITAANTVVNTVSTALSANAAAGATSITVASVTGLSAGDLIYIVQMQGAIVPAYVQQFGNPNDALPNDTSSGKVRTNAYNGAGNNEFAEINSISGNVITLNCALNDSFRGNTSTGSIRSQVVRVPRYTSLTLSGTGSIICNAWNGTTGGVIVIEVQGNTTLASGTSINASAKGFRGGSPLRATGYGSTSTGHNYGTAAANNGAHKGESIVGDTNIYKLGINYNSMPLTICKANVANGGGGGNSMNCGGGGGSNGGSISLWNGMGNPDATYAAVWTLESTTPANGTVRPTSSSGGGRGGYAFSANSSGTADPTVNGPNSNSVWGGDSRHNDGGWGGTPLDYSTGKIFLGGGGGAGDGNDGHASGGGNGGGIIYLVSYGTVSGAGQIISDGGSPLATSTFGSGGNGDDGAGGGGGGGAIIINSVGTVSLTAATPISAQGGKGGDNNYNGITTNTNCYGPGGGGGGGYIATTNAVTGITINAGTNGSVTGALNTSRIKTKFPPNGATAGGAGTTATSVAPFYLTATNYTTCVSSAVSLSVTVNGTTPSGLSVMWYTVATGGTSVFTGNPYAITAPSTAGTYTYYAGTCPGLYRIPIILTVNSAAALTLTVSATNTTVCTGTPVMLTVSGATSYTWGTNAGSATTNTVLVSPTVNTTYTVTGVTTGACAGTATSSININTTSPPTITVTPSSYTLCSGATATLTANSSTTSYTWSANAGSATTGTVAVSPPVGSTTYTVTGGSGACTSTQTVAINVTATPTLVVAPTNTYICNGSSATFTVSGATTYSWSTAALTNTVSVSPASNTTYTVTGFNGTCADTKTVLVKVDGGIKKADSTLTSASCGQANGAYVLNSITGGVSPYQINFNGTGFTNIPAFSYSVNAIAGGAYPIIFKDSLGCAYTTSVTIGNTSGITQVDSSVTKANCVPLASGAINIISITGGVAPYQININSGTFNAITSFPYPINNLTAGTYTVNVKDGTNCPHTSYIIVGSNVGVTSATVTPIADTCNRHVGEIDIIQIVGGTTPYAFALNNGSYQTVSTFTALAASTTDTVKIKDANGCVYIAPSATVTNVGNIPTPTITASPNATFCQGDSATLTSSSTYHNIWSTGLTADTTNKIIVKNSGNYFVVVSNNGCSATSNTITVAVKPLPVTVVAPTSIFCQNQLPQVVPITGPTSATLTVYNSLGQTLPTPLTPTVSGFYFIKDSLNGCTTVTKILVTINPAPTVAPNVTTPVQYCIGAPASALTATATTGATLVWQDSTHAQISNSPPTPATNSTGTTTYYVYQSVGTCNSPTATVQVVVFAKPNPNFSANPAIDISVGQSITFTPVQTTTVNTYVWSFGDPANPMATSTQAIPHYIYNTAGTYCPRLVVTNTVTGCTETTSICVDVLANITMVIPNVFSPNGDAINDVFSIKANGFTSLTCDIFDRWGLKLYSFSGANGYWDGGKSVDGTYFYVVQATDVKGEDHKYNGFIQLIK